MLSAKTGCAHCLPKDIRRMSCAELRPNVQVLSGPEFGPCIADVVRAEFLRARNFEYVKAARALGLGNRKIMFRHILPNAMVATLTFLPFILTGAITGLTSLDFLGFGLPSGSPSLGELIAQGKANLHAPWLGISAFVSLSVMLTLLVFVGEAVRDAFDPRKS